MAIISATIFKDTKEVKTGIIVAIQNGSPQIRRIVPDSLFAKNAPQIKPGMRIVSINNVECNGKTPSEVTRLIKDKKGRIKILVDDEIQQSNQPIIAEAYYCPPVNATIINTNADSEENDQPHSYVPATIIRSDNDPAINDEPPIRLSDEVVYADVVGCDESLKAPPTKHKKKLTGIVCCASSILVLLVL